MEYIKLKTYGQLPDVYCCSSLLMYIKMSWPGLMKHLNIKNNGQDKPCRIILKMRWQLLYQDAVILSQQQ